MPIAGAIDINDTYSPNAGNNLTITDIYRAPQDGNTRVFVRVAIQSPVKNGTDNLLYNGNTLQIQRQLTISTDEYQVNGRILSRGDSDQLNQEISRVVIDTTVPVNVAEDMDAGDTLVGIGQEELGTVESVSVYPTDSSGQARAIVGLSLQTITRESTQQFGDTQIDTGATLSARTQQYEFSGEITRDETTEQIGVEQTRTVTLRLESVSPAQAERIQEGLVDRFSERTFARLVDVKESPSQTTVTTSDGELILADHPVNKDLTITAELIIRETQSGIFFKRSLIEPGQRITLRFNGVTIRPVVTSV